MPRENAAVILPRLPAVPRRRSAALAAAALVALLAPGCGSSSSSSHSLTRSPLISIFEAGPQLRSNPAATIDTMHHLGVDVVKVFVPWIELAPNATSRTPPQSFNGADPNAYPAAAWAPFDAIVRDAAARGIAVDLTINSPPLWAAGPGAPPGAHPQWRPSATAYGQFMRAVGTRYSGSFKPAGSAAPLPRVRYWSIWNEPNFGPDLAPQAIDHSTVEVSPALYRGLVDAAWSALGATGHGHDTILIGELAPRGQTGGSHPGDFDGMVPLRFLRALYCVDASLHPLTGSAAAARDCPTGSGSAAAFRKAHPALFQAPGFADHPYGQGRVPPNVLTPDEPDFADFPALPKLQSTLDRLQEVYGSSHRFPIYSTEFGYQTDPPERITYAASPKLAAFFLNWAEYLSWRNPRIASYDQYLLMDSPVANAAGGFATGLRFANGTPKATLAAYRLPIFMPVTSAPRSQKLEVWGHVRPARYARGSASGTVRIQFRSASGGSFETIRTVALSNPYGFFDVQQEFPGSGVVRLAWSYPNGTAIHSRPVDLNLH